MSAMKKTFVLVCAGVMMLAALALSGCFGFGGDDTPGDASIEGTWKLSYAEDYYGNPYDTSEMTDEIVLEVKSSKKATFYYFDDDPFPGTLSRDASGDSYYATDGYTTLCYHLTNSDGRWWEFCFVVPDDGGDAFWYLEVGPEDDYDAIYLERA